MKKEFTFSKKLASYSALAATVLMVSETADAQIIYTDVNPNDLVNSPGSYILDLNNDGTTDFQFNLLHSITSTTFIVDRIRVVGSGSNSALEAATSGMVQGYYYAGVLDTGAVIDGGDSFQNKALLATHSSGFYGNWVNKTERFLGLKLIINSNTYYGWARLSVNAACNQLIVSDYAVDTVANDGIITGDKCGNYSLYANPVINPSDSVTLCEGSYMILATDSIAGFTYQWTVNSTVIPGADNFNFTADVTGSFSVTVTNAYGCVDTSISTLVTVFPLPEVPVISQTGYTLNSTVGDSYQWYLNGVLLAGATGQSYTPSQGGDYTVQIKGANGCLSLSDPYTFIPIGISNAEDPGISVFEADNIVVVQLNDSRFLDGTIKIFNALGGNVYSSMVKSEAIQIDLSHLPAGSYLLTIDKSGKSITRKIVIQ